MTSEERLWADLEMWWLNEQWDDLILWLEFYKSCEQRDET